MPRELSEIFGEASEVLTGIDFSVQGENRELSAEARKAIETLKKASQPFYQSLVNIGYGASEAKASKEISTLKAKLEDTEKKLAERPESTSTPDIKTLNAEWETKLNQEKDARKEDRKKSKAELRNALLQRDQATLESKLIQMGVPPVMAEAAARSRSVEERMDYDDDATLSIRQAGQKIPFTPGEGQTHLDMMASEIVSKIDRTLLRSDADGNGSGAENRGTGGGKAKDADFLTNLKKGVEEQEKKRVTTAEPLRDRIAKA